MTVAPQQARLAWPMIFGFWALVAALLIARTALQWGTVPLLGDSDDAMRMVTAADLLHGQGWQDLTEHRDNAPYGASMHWSRLVDAPIALLLAAATPIFGPLAADVVAVMWPLLLMLPLLALSVATIRRLVPDAGTITALTLPIASFVVLIEFLPGRVDHHNVQILLTLFMALALLVLRDRATGGLVVGLAMATSLAIGLETLPMVVAAATAVACVWLADPMRYRRLLSAFGAALGIGTLAHFLLATTPESYLAPACDMLSVTYVVPALLGGAGFVVAAAFTSTLPWAWQRMFVLLFLGCITVAVTAATFPQCLAGPYAALDQVLPGYFDTIAEAQPLWIRAFTDPPTAVAFALTTLLALPVTAWHAWRGRGESRVDWLILLGFLAGGALVMVMQLRGARLAAPFALPAAAYVILLARRLYLANPGAARAASLLGSWVLFAGVAHYAIVGATIGWFGPRPAQASGLPSAEPWQECFLESNYVTLASLPPGVVMAPSWNGAHLLRYTPHSVVSAGFHRNLDGIVAAETFFSGDEQRAREIAAERNVSYVAFCPANTKHPTMIGPTDDLHWSWLEPLSPPEHRLQIYRVRL